MFLNKKFNFFTNKDEKIEGFNLEDVNLLRTISMNSVNPTKTEFEIIQSEDKTKMENKMDEKTLANALTESFSSVMTKLMPKQAEKEMVEKAELDSVITQLGTVKAELEASKSEIETAKFEGSEAKKAAEEKIAELNTKIETLETENKALNEKVEAVEAEKAQKAEEVLQAKYLAEAKEYTGLVGTEEEIAAKLRKIDESIEDETVREDVKAALKLKSNSGENLQSEKGSEAGGEEITEKQKAEAKIYAEAEVLAKEENISVPQAINRITNGKCKPKK